MSAEQTTIGAKVPADLKKRVRVEAAERGMTMSEFVRSELEESLE